MNSMLKRNIKILKTIIMTEIPGFKSAKLKTPFCF